MKLAYYAAFALLLAAKLPGRAQLLPPPPATDTASHFNASGFVQYRMGTITQVDGTTITGYMPCNLAGYGGGKLIYYLPPLSIDSQLRHPHTIKISKIKQMAVHGRLYETVQRKGKNIDILALRLFEGPISLSMYTEPRAIPVPIPIFMGSYTSVPLLNIKISNKDHWYLRLNGVCTEMPRARFAEQMSAFLLDNPELAGKVARQEPNYLYANTPAIIAEYNQAKAGGK